MRVAFLMEQHIGHRTFYLNLRRYAAVDQRIEPRWVEITYFRENGWIEKSGLVPAGVKGSLRGFIQARQGWSAAPSDVYYFHTQVPAAFLADRLRWAPYILSTDITPIQFDTLAGPYGHKPDAPGPLKSVKHRLNLAVFRQAAQIVAWSNWVRGSLISDYGVPPEKISVIPPGVDLETWQPETKGPPDPARPLKLLFVGGDFTRKGGHLLLEALTSLAAARPGQPAMELHLVTHEAVPHVPGMFIYHGLKSNSPELARLVRQADMFILPTLAEAFGIAAVEALASGLPVIASRVGGLDDVVSDGRNGILLPSGDVQALSQAILRLVADAELRRRMSLEARRTAEEQFDARKNANRLVTLIVDVTRRKHA